MKQLLKGSRRGPTFDELMPIIIKVVREELLSRLGENLQSVFLDYQAVTIDFDVKLTTIDDSMKGLGQDIVYGRYLLVK